MIKFAKKEKGLDEKKRGQIGGELNENRKKDKDKELKAWPAE